MTPKWAEHVLARSMSHARATFSFKADEHYSTGSNYTDINKGAICQAAKVGLCTLIEQGYRNYPGNMKTLTLDQLSHEVHAECQVQIQRDIVSGRAYAAVYTICLEYPCRLQPMLKSHLLTRDGCIMLNLLGRKVSTPAQFHYNSDPIDDTLPGAPVRLLQFKADRPISPETLLDCLNANGGDQGFTVLYAGKAAPAPPGSTGFIIDQLVMSRQADTLSKAANLARMPGTVAVPWATGALPSGIVALVRGGQKLLPKPGSKGGFTLQAVSASYPAAQVDIRVQMSRVSNRPETQQPSAVARNPANPWGTAPGSACAAAAAPDPVPAAQVTLVAVTAPSAPTAPAAIAALSAAPDSAAAASTSVAASEQTTSPTPPAVVLPKAIAATPTAAVTMSTPASATPDAVAAIPPVTNVAGTTSKATAVPVLPQAPATLLDVPAVSLMGLDMALDLQVGTADATAEHQDFAKVARHKIRPGLEYDADDRHRKSASAQPRQKGHSSDPSLDSPVHNEITHMGQEPALVTGASAGELR